MKIGDKVKFKDYDHHEYVHHKGEVATITSGEGSGDYGVEWADGRTSLAWASKDYWGMYLAEAAIEEIKEVKEDILESLEDQVKLGKYDILGQDKIHQQLDIAVGLKMPVLIVGETGTGKTTIVKSVAKKHEAEWIRFNLTGETTVDEFVGKYVLKDQQTVWEDGILLQAMKAGKWLIVDEVNVALPEILFVLHSLLDDDQAVMVSNHKGEVVRPHEEFRFFGTMNPVDEYAGTKDLNKAFKSRFGMILNMEYPEVKIETAVVGSKGNVSQETSSKIVDIARKIRQAKKADEIFYTCSTRDLIQWANLSNKLPLQDAFEVAILNKANGDGEKISKIYQDVVGEYTKAEAEGVVLNLDRLKQIHSQLKTERETFNSEQLKIKAELKKELIEQLVDGAKPTKPAAKPKVTPKKPAKRKAAKKTRKAKK